MEKRENEIVNATGTDSSPLPSEDANLSSAPSTIQRNALLFDPTVVVEQQQQEEEDNDFYELGTNDLRMMLRSLREENKKQRALLPARFVKEKDRELKQRAYKRTVVRFRLSVGHVLQAQFLSTEPVSALFKFVRDIITPTLQFELRQVPASKLRSDDATSLLDAEIAPKCVLILKIIGVDQQPNHLAANSTTTTELSADQFFVPDHFRLCSQPEASAAAEEWLAVNTEFRPYLSTILDKLPSDEGNSSGPGQASSSTPSDGQGVTRTTKDDGTSLAAMSGTRTSTSELPKWLKRK
uniref:UBX domain-containing protein n=1 Tax=Globodera pallida TaxID=36090 RepID=A0A183BJQ6_GLOPA